MPYYIVSLTNIFNNIFTERFALGIFYEVF